MFGSTNTGTTYWSGSTQPNTNLPGAFNALGANAQSNPQMGSTFTGFGSTTNTGSTGFMGQSTTPSFGISQNTSLFGQPAQQPTTTGFGTMGTTGGLFDQNKQGFMGNSGGLFGQPPQTGSLFGSGLNTTTSSTFGSTMNTGTSLFGNNTTTGGLWSGSTSSTFGSQIQGTEVATLKHFDGASITHIAYDKPDTCQEEYRWEYYKKVNPQFGLPIAQQGATSTGGLFGSTQPTTTPTGGLFGSTQPPTTGSLFGNTQPTTTTGGLFGSTQPSTTSTGGLFGSTQPTTSGGLFGSTTTPTTGGGLFGSTQPTTTTTGGLFGNTQPTTTTGGLFGSTQPTTTTGGLFGSTQPSTTGTGGLFGNTQPTTGLFGSTQPTTGGTTGLLGSTQPSTSTSSPWANRTTHGSTGLFGNTTPAPTTTTSTGLFGNTTGTSTSTGLFGSSTTSAFGGANKGLFGNTTTPTTTGTTGTGLFGSTNVFAPSATQSTGTTGTTGLFGSTTTPTTGGSLFGNTQPTTTTSVPNVFASSTTTTNTMPAPSTTIFGATPTTGTTGLFGSTTNQTGNTAPLFTFGSAGSQPFGSTTAAQQMQPSDTMRLGSINFKWGVNTPSPGLRSFWTNEADLPPEAKEYLAKLANTTNNAAQGSNAAGGRNQSNSNPDAQSSTAIPDLDDSYDRFGLRQVLKDLGVQIPRYSVHQDEEDEIIKYQRTALETRRMSQMSGEERAESDMSRTFIKASKVQLASKLPSKNGSQEGGGEIFLSLHNGGTKALDALRYQARGGHLRKLPIPVVENRDELPYLPSNRSSVVFDKSSNATSNRGDVLTLTDSDQSYNERPHRTLDDVYKIRSDTRGSESNPSEDSARADDASSLTGTAPKEPADACPIFKLADNAPGHPPILTKEGYTTRPTMSSLRQMSDKQLANVMDFQVIREGFGDILWPGYTDVRQLNLDNIVDIAHRKVTMYGNTSRVHPVGEGLNKSAIVTLQNCAPRDYTEGASITSTVEQLEKLKDHTASLGCKFISANFKTGQWVYEAPYFVKNTNGDASEHKGITFTS
ncbi:Nucleoporin2, putative [Babesia bigemina]|uniref:Nucleoporin2, putative n=1 Tax=Babesia bigemina TaxID=5866 RepID=A0A061D7Y0_BABBI|nr:Nucleoporin2, putative [Babesia bigemina]CDR96653.1 Nucleoporin2, putative [Babesia bigemina]|eukprot:XP_012768839.1 Nucleoporin2, putative [Babesia bigemina]